VLLLSGCLVGCASDSAHIDKLSESSIESRNELSGRVDKETTGANDVVTETHEQLSATSSDTLEIEEIEPEVAVDLDAEEEHINQTGNSNYLISIDTIMINGEEYKTDCLELNLSHVCLTDDDKRNLNQFSNLKELTLDSHEYDLGDLSFLHELDSVEELRIVGTINDFSFFNEMKCINRLDLVYFFGSLDKIPQNETIKEFSLGESRVETINGIENLHALTSVSLYHIDINDRSALGKIPNLKSLNISYDDTEIIDLSFLENLVELETLSYDLVPGKTIGHSAIGNCTKLKYLSIFAGIDDIDFIENLINLEHFYLQGYKSNRAFYDISKLINCKNLKSVELDLYDEEYSGIVLNDLKSKLPNCEFNVLGGR
jgi:hypothetical protein